MEFVAETIEILFDNSDGKAFGNFGGKGEIARNQYCLIFSKTKPNWKCLQLTIEMY